MALRLVARNYGSFPKDDGPMTRISHLTGGLVNIRAPRANGQVDLQRGRLMFVDIAGYHGAGHSKLTMKLKEVAGKPHE
jgi:hypothetical protein